ncbi:MAG TPA: homoserine kinase [Candidatus Nitrosopolaris sp.]|nr:homoserine kinase [Candidatus Nitrosopolaris sp.]
MIQKSGGYSCTAAAPCSSANLGPGFDVFGLSLDAFEDKVKITSRVETSRRLTICTVGKTRTTVPLGPDDNCAGAVLKKMSVDFGISDSLSVYLDKQVPAGMGVGSSAASSVAAAVAFNRLYDLKIDKTKLVEYAAEGELVSAGIKHYDNVSSSLLGGFVIVRTSPQLEFIRIDPPKDLVMIIAVPSIKVPLRKTEIARRVLPKVVPLKKVIQNVSNACTIVSGFLLKDVETIAKGIEDMIVEPRRKDLIPGYEKVKMNALSAGALAVTISGAGPSMISFLRDDEEAIECVAHSMTKGFKEAKIQSRTYTCRASKGARVIHAPP